MNPAELEKLIDAELRKLPQPRAPQSLGSRVLAAIQAQAVRPWYQRPWLTWPWPWQVGSATVVLAVLALGFIGLTGLHSAGIAYLGQLAGRASDRVASLLAGIASPLNAVAVLYRAMVQPVLLYVLAFVAVMLFLCAALGSALGRIVMKEARAS